MFEVLVTVAIVVVLALSAWLPPTMLMWVGAGILGLGALVGVPAGLVYHAQLWRALRAGGHATEGMWIRPHALHHQIAGDEGERIRALFAVGALGFGGTMLGAVALVIGFVRLAF